MRTRFAARAFAFGLVVAGLFAATSPSKAFPIAGGGEGFSVFAAGGEIFATYEGNSAAFSNDLYLGGLFIFNNHATPVGTTVSLGTFAAGDLLTFRLHVNPTGYDYFTGPAGLNPDGHAHARVQSNWLPGTTLVSFEDLYNGPFDFNDLSFSFTNTVGAVAATPIPAALPLFVTGLGVMGFLAHRRKRKAQESV